MNKAERKRRTSCVITQNSRKSNQVSTTTIAGVCRGEAIVIHTHTNGLRDSWPNNTSVLFSMLELKLNTQILGLSLLWGQPRLCVFHTSWLGSIAGDREYGWHTNLPLRSEHLFVRCNSPRKPLLWYYQSSLIYTSRISGHQTRHF